MTLTSKEEEDMALLDSRITEVKCQVTRIEMQVEQLTRRLNIHLTHHEDITTK